MSTFYFGTKTKFVLGTNPYYVQQMGVKKEANPLTAVPQSNELVEPKVKFHDREDLPALPVDMVTLKRAAKQDVVKIVEARLDESIQQRYYIEIFDNRTGKNVLPDQQNFCFLCQNK
eukprot:gene7614-21255_t